MNINGVKFGCAVGIGCIGVLYMKGVLSTVILLFAYLVVILIGSFIGCYVILSKGRNFQPVPRCRESGKFLKVLMERNLLMKTTLQKHQSTVITRNIDNALDEVISLIVRDYFIYFLNDLVYDSSKLADSLTEDAWAVIKNIRSVLAKIDQVKFITNDVTNKLHQHFIKIRFSSIGDSKEPKPVFLLKSYLINQETEMEFLRKISEALLVLLLPPSYKSCEPVQHLLREVLACLVLYPTIELLCNPDYINEKLLYYFQYQQEVADNHKKTYSYAATYEDFIKMINESVDIEHLKQMRYKIMSEIMQATTISNLKKAKGIDVDKEFIPQGGHKGDLLQARNLKRYINQLKCAKNQCEKKIKYLGGPDYTSPSSPTSHFNDELSPHIPGNKVFSFQVIMENTHARKFFGKFLQKDNCQVFISFWEIVDEMKQVETMKQVDKKCLHNLGNEAYNIYGNSIHNTLKLEKNVIKGIEAFLTGDKGPESFYAAQEIISHYLEERQYPCFIVSDVYHRMLRDGDNLGIDFMSSSRESNEDLDEGLELAAESANNPGICLSDHSNFAKDKLKQLGDRLKTKVVAFHAIEVSNNPDMKMMAKLEKEIENMKAEQLQLQNHIERTEIWSENLGKWTIYLQNYEMIMDKDKPTPTFTMVVYLKGNDYDFYAKDSREWTVSKRISDFSDLNRKLIQIGPWLKQFDLPREGKMLFKNYDKLFLEKAKLMIQSYMEFVLSDDKINKSEVLYTFLSPTPQLLKQPMASKKNKNFLTNLFKGQASSGQTDSSDDDEFLFLDDDASTIKDDPIAEPLYALIGEIFDMRGVFKLLRRTLISFVQITYGRTINRQLRDTVSWLFSESMIVYYIHLFRDAMWPNGVLANPSPPKTKQQKLQMQFQARQQFVANIPEVLNNLVGEKNARKGALKVFECLQEEKLNKQLLYELLELLLFEILTSPKTN